MASTIRILPYNYIHIKNLDTNMTRIEVGPQILVKRENEELMTSAPKPMICLTPLTYIVINNPVCRDEDGNPIRNSFGEVEVRHVESEYRFYEQYTTPFPLYPKESAEGEPRLLEMIGENQHYHLSALRQFTDATGTERLVGDTWTQNGLSIYYPNINVVFVGSFEAKLVTVGKALKVRAKQALTDAKGVARVASEEWLVRERGSYLPGPYEEVIGMLDPYVLTDEKALMLKAKRSFTDIYGIQRGAGTQWLLTRSNASTHILDINEEFVSQPKVCVLKTMQYCYIKNPFSEESGSNTFGTRIVRRGPCSFFLNTNEEMDGKIRDMHILSKKQALVVQAQQSFTDSDGVKRQAGEEWMECGPQGYLPPVEVSIIRETDELCLDKNEGIYVRDMTTGQKRAVIGQNYMLKSDEVRFSIDLPAMTLGLMKKEDPLLDQSRLVSYAAPFNSCVQVFDYQKKLARYVWGPELVQLGPDESITVHILSGGKPKMPGVIKSLYVSLGPDFTSDILEVETSDHCRMNIFLSYNWFFNVDKSSQEAARRIFTIRDFIGDLCTVMAAKIRSAVAAKSFDDFHKSSAKLIRSAIFGVNENGKIKDQYVMDSNGMTITNLDIKRIEPIDQKTSDALKQTVSLAIECVTQQVEDQAMRTANENKQEAEGKLERLKIIHKTTAEKANIELLKLEAESRSIQESGEANAQAEAKSKAAIINASAKVELGRLSVEAEEKMALANHKRQTDTNAVSLSHQKFMSELRITKQTEMTDIETSKFEAIMETLGQDTLMAIANSGMQSQVDMLEGLGLKGYLLTDGQTPINLFNAAEGMVGRSKK